MRGSRITCCIVGCGNSYYNTDSSVRFYSFPNRWYEKDRKKMWINNIRRVMPPTNLKWEPTKYDKICSSHFVGNCKSNHPDSPSFNPTLFPKEYRKRKSNPDLKKKLFERVQNRRATRDETQSNQICSIENIGISESIPDKCTFNTVIYRKCEDNNDGSFECSKNRTVPKDEEDDAPPIMIKHEVWIEESWSYSSEIDKDESFQMAKDTLTNSDSDEV